MAQGMRGRWLRVAATGLGVMLCTGLAGCLNSDKPKDTKLGTKQPGFGLPGTPTLPGGAGGTAKGGTPSPYGAPGSGVLPAGGLQPGAGQTRFGTSGLNTNTSGTSQPYNWPAQPGAGGIIGSPALPGPQPSVLPVGGVGMANPYDNRPGTASAYAPPVEMPLLPPPPPSGGSAIGPDLAGIPSPGSLGPVLPPPVPPVGTTGKGPPLSGYGNP